AASFGLVRDCDSFITDDPDPGPVRIEALSDRGTFTTVSDLTHGSGADLEGPSGVAIDQARDRALVVEGPRRALIAVDLATGDRAVVADDDIGAGPSLTALHSVAWDAAGQRAFVAGSDGVFEVDVASGDRRLVSSETVGGGVEFNAGRIAWDAIGARLLMTSIDLIAVVAIDPQSGARTEFTGPTRGAGPQFENMRGVVVDDVAGVAYVSDVNRNALVAVDLDTGDRTIVAGESRGTGPTLANVQMFALSIDGMRMSALDWSSDRVLEIDLLTGSRTVLTDQGLDGRTPWAMARWDRFNRLILVRR
ncbi:MAG: hypothetical protein OER88_09535, partial [Planctomycetota bacterium]|nr:hypothetical protein [Planctomycetota bacterium]